MSDDKVRLLEYSMREVAHLYAAENTDKPQQAIFTRYDDGIDIPPGTVIRVTVELLHKPDPLVTPILSAAELV